MGGGYDASDVTAGERNGRGEVVTTLSRFVWTGVLVAGPQGSPSWLLRINKGFCWFGSWLSQGLGPQHLLPQSRGSE